MSELENQKVDAVIRLENGKMNIVLEGSDSSKKSCCTSNITKKVQRRTIYR